MSGDSLTPPLSPEVALELEDIVNISPPKAPRIEGGTRFACFNCLGEVSTKESVFHGESYWRTGFLQGLYNSPSCHNLPSVKKYQIFTCFSHTWTNTVLQNSNIDKLFLILRQQIGEIQSSAQRSRLSFLIDYSVDWQDVREQTCKFLQYLMDSLISGFISEEEIDRLVSNLHALLLCTGRLGELPHNVIQSTSPGNKASVSSQCLHLHLDVYWRLLSIFHVLQIKYPELSSGQLSRLSRSLSRVSIVHQGFLHLHWLFNDAQVPYGPLCQFYASYSYSRKLSVAIDYDLDYPLYDQLLQILLWDLVCLANVRYMNKVADHDTQKTALFSCTCIQELWSLILKLTEWRANNHIGESFWISLHHVIKSILEMEGQDPQLEVEDSTVVLNPPEGFRTEDPVGLCLWIMYSVAPLYTQEVLGSTTNESIPVSNYHDLQILLKQLLSKPDLSEVTLRRHLKTCLLMTSNWEPNTGILITLWDFFYKRLNQSESYQSSSGSLEGLACIDQSVVSMYERCKQWTQGHIGSLDKETSYQLFLRLMSEHVGKLYSSGSIQEWKQVKGRIYSKFHVRRIQELMEGGLYNLSTLFITLGMTADLEDVASKLCDFYDMLDIQSVTFGKRSVVWRGAFTLMIVYEDREMDVTFLADRMVAAFDNAVSDFGTAGIDSRHCLWNLILIYLEGLQEVVETSPVLQLSEYKLLCPAVQKLLTVCSEHELRTTLSTLHSVIQKFRQVKLEQRNDALVTVRESLQHAEFSGALWMNVYSFIVEHAQTLTPPPIVADTAASFCLLALSCPADDKTLTFVSVFQTFASSDKVNVGVSCRFLSHLLSCPEVMERLQSDLDNYEQVVVSAWFRCCLYVPAGSQMLVEITRPVLQLSTVQEALHQSELASIEDIDKAPIVFLKALEKCHRKIETWQGKMEFQQKVIPYFCDVQKHIAPVLRNLGPAEVVNNVFKMTGYLIKYCAKLIYVRQDVIVPGLISSLILPHNVHNPDKPLSPVFLSAVKDHLHLGLSKLPYERDPFVQRRLRDIVTIYLPKFSLRSGLVTMTTASVTTVHPVVASLSGSFIQNPSPDAVKFRHYLVQTVISSFIVVTNMTVHQYHSLGFSFLHDVVQRTTSPEVKARDLPVVLTVCLEYLLLCPSSSSVWRTVMGTIQQLIEAYASAGQSIQMSEMTTKCEQFISNYFKFSSTGVLKLMEKLALLFQDLVTTVVDKLSDCVKDIENKRGIGSDQKLRGQYYQVLKQLGEKGAQEIQKLQIEAS